MKVFNKYKLEIRYINKIKGFGVFTLEKINLGDIVETCYYIPTDIHSVNPLHDYLYSISINNKNINVLAFGYASIYNHSDSPNMHWKVSELDNRFLEFYSLKEIQCDEELCHSYGDEYWNYRKRNIKIN
jgi:SET domain-containing protein